MTQQNPAESGSVELNGLDSLVEKWAERDKGGYEMLRSPQLRRLAAQLQENFAVSSRVTPPSVNQEARDLFKKAGFYKEIAKAQGLARVDEVTQGSDIAVIALQILPMITRAIATNPIFQLVDSIPMSGPSANIVYFDMLYGSSGGSYISGSRVDINDDRDYSNRGDCTVGGRELNARINRETTTATDKVLAAQICITAIQDAEAQFGVSLRDMLRDRIYRIMVREWGRLVTDDLRTMAGVTASWSATPAGPYSSLNTNEWRKVLFETLVTSDATVRTRVYEPTEWLLWTPATAAILERINRVNVPLMQQPLQGQAQPVSSMTGEFGETVGRWQAYQDPYFAANSILGGRKTFNLVPNSPYYFLPYQFMDNVAELFLPRTQMLELGGITRAARKMVEPNAYFLVSIT